MEYFIVYIYTYICISMYYNNIFYNITTTIHDEDITIIGSCALKYQQAPS